MSIASRITAMQEHLRDDYDVLNLAGADLTNVDKNIINLKPTWKERLLYFMNNGTDEVWNNWNKVTGEGEEISLNNTLEAKMKIVLKGNTYQEGTPTPESPQDIHVVSGDNSIVVCGKNLFDYTKQQATTAGVATQLIDNGVRVIMSATGTYKFAVYKVFDASSHVGETYTLTLTANKSGNNSYQVNVLMCDENGGNRVLIQQITEQNVNYTITIPTISGSSKYLGISLYATGSSSANAGDYIDYTNIQLEKGNQATTYEEYKSASYPINLGNIELCKIGTYQDKIDKSTGKNLLNPELLLQQTSWNKFTIQAQPNTSYTISTNFPNDGKLLLYMNNADTYGASYQVYTGHPVSITTDNSGVIYIMQRTTDINVLFSNYATMLNEGTTALPYEPYGTSWYKYSAIGKYTFTGNESFTKSGYTTNDIWYMWWTTTSLNILGINGGYCSFGEVGNRTNMNNQNNGIIYNVASSSEIVGTCFVQMQKSQITGWDESLTDAQKIALVKALLPNQYFYYVLATPTYTEITDTTLIGQLEALDKGKSYEGQTNLSQTSNDLASIMSATALEEM